MDVLKELVLLLVDILEGIFLGFFNSSFSLFFWGVIYLWNRRIIRYTVYRTCKLDMLKEVGIMHRNGPEYDIMHILSKYAFFISYLLLFHNFIEG